MDIVKRFTLNKAPKEIPLGSIVCAKNIMVDKTASYIKKDVGVTSDLGLNDYEHIVGVIPFTNVLIIFVHADEHTVEEDTIPATDYIYVYDGNNLLLCDSVKWNWSGGKITGDASRNYKGDIICVVAEYDAPNTKVPLKIYNLNNGNIHLTGNQEEEIPQFLCSTYLTEEGNLVCGTYTYFVRYKISENNYTKWFQITNDIQILSKYLKENSSHQYLNAGTDSTYSAHTLSAVTYGSEFSLNKNDVSNYGICISVTETPTVEDFDEFQLGVIIKHDTSIVGRIVGNYDITTQLINIVDNSFIETIEINEFLKSPTQYYNVKNAIIYGNRLYISNYEEYNNYSFDDFVITESGNQFNTVEAVQINYDKKDPSTYSTITEGKTTYNATSNIGYTSATFQGSALKVELNEHNYIIKKDKFLSDFIVKKLIPAAALTITAEDKDGNDKDITFDSVSSQRITYIKADNNTYINAAGDKVKVDYFAVIPEIGLYNTISKRCYPLFKGTNEDPNLDYYGNAESGTPIKLIVADNKLEFYVDTAYHIDITSSTNVRFYIRYRIKLSDGNVPFENDAWSPVKYYTNNFLFKDAVKPFYVPNDYVGPTLGLSSITENHEQDTETVVVGEVINNRTLLPYQKYNLFIHYVRKDGSCTNGYPLTNMPIMPTLANFVEDNAQKLLGFKFSNVYNPKPNEFIGWFVSYEKLINTTIPVSVVEVNTVSGVTKLKLTTSSYIYANEILKGKKLYFADDNYFNVSLDNNAIQRNLQQTPYCTFVIDDVDADVSNIGFGSIGYLVIEPTALYSNKIKTLYRLTDTYYTFGALIEQNNFKYLPGFYAKQAIPLFVEKKPSEHTILQDIISSPTTSYILNSAGQNTNYDIYNITNYVYSNINLDALSVKQDYQGGAFIWTYYDAQNNQHNITYYNKALTPSIVQDFLEIMPAYTALPDKSYTNYSNQYNTAFNQTVRRSDVLSDESAYIGFRNFEADNYKNIFENKGDIVNLVGIGLYLLIHTRYSLFVIDRTSRLTSQAKLVTPDTFDEDYKEASPSNEGFGGLVDKKEAVLTKYGYIWLDKENKYILRYDSGKLDIMSVDINGFLQNETIVSCRFSEDVENNRLLICLGIDVDDEINYLTFSYSFDTSTFISLHDYIFTDAYNTYSKSYLMCVGITEDNVDNKLFTYGGTRLLVNQLTYKNTKLFNTYSYFTRIGLTRVECLSSYVDVIFNGDYEIPKVLEYIKYTLSKITHTYQTQGIVDNINSTYSGDKLLVYTNNGNTGLVDIRQEENFNDSNENLGSPNYKKPYFEKGVWAFNFFRTFYVCPNDSVKSTDELIEDSIDIMNIDPSSSDYEGNIIIRNNDDYYKRPCLERPLLYGKYFVIRFRFDSLTDFKLESIVLKLNKY